MTTTVIYKCDRCGNEQKPRHENGGYPPLWTVAIICEPIDHPHQYYPMRRQQAEWCRACINELGVTLPLVRAETEQKPPTIEDMIREIVRQEQEGE